jgi:hypothetical protein
MRTIVIGMVVLTDTTAEEGEQEARVFGEVWRDLWEEFKTGDRWSSLACCSLRI